MCPLRGAQTRRKKNMTALGEVGTVKEISPALGVKMILLETPATFIGGTDSVALDLGDYGASKVSAVFASSQTTTGDVLADATVSVDSNTSGVIVMSTSAAGTNVYGIVLFVY